MSGPLPFTLTGHARLILAERRISPDWIAAALASPARIHPDADDPALLHALRPIPAFDNRILRVVYNPAPSPPLVVTAYFDRSLKGTL